MTVGAARGFGAVTFAGPWWMALAWLALGWAVAIPLLMGVITRWSPGPADALAMNGSVR